MTRLACLGLIAALAVMSTPAFASDPVPTDEVTLQLAADPRNAAAPSALPVPGVYTGRVCTVSFTFKVTGRQGNDLIGTWDMRTHVNTPGGSIGPDAIATGKIVGNTAVFDVTALGTWTFSSTGSGRVVFKNKPVRCTVMEGSF